MDREDFRWQLVAKLDAIMKKHNIPLSTPASKRLSTPSREMKRALEERQAELLRAELLKFQTGWIEKQKAKWAKTHKPNINPADFCPTLTTR
jgi:hypothetical protein